MKKIYILLIISGLAVSAWAQNTPAKRDSLRTLEEVVVREKRRTAAERQEFLRHAQSVEALTEVEINRGNPAFLEQTLGHMAGVQVDRRTQLGGQRIVVRGYGNDQKFNNWGIKIYYNGVPMTTADGVTILDDMDFGVMNKIEVVKGPAATLYGGGVGGVVRFYSVLPAAKGVYATQKTMAGAFGLLQSTSRIDFVRDSSAISFNYGHLQSDGFRPNGNSLKNFFTFLSNFKLNKRQSVEVFVSQNYSYEGVTGQIPYADYYAGIDNGNPAYTKKNSRNNILGTRFALTHQYAFSPRWSNRTSIFYLNQDFKRVAAGADESSMNPSMGLRSVFTFRRMFSGSWTNETTAGVEIQQSRSLISNYRFTGTNEAVPLQVRDISAGSYFKNFSQQTSLFAQTRFDYRPWDVSVLAGVSSNALRYQRTDLLAVPGLLPNYNKDLSFGKQFAPTLNPHIALQKVWGKQLINLSYSEGYNAPTLATAFIGALNKTNDNLVPERARMIDLAWHGLAANSRLDYQFSVFSMLIYNKLTQLSGVLPTGGSYTYFANTGNQLNRGIELSTSYLWLLPKGSSWQRVEPFVHATLYDFRYADFKTRFNNKLEDYTGRRVVGVPVTKITAGIDVALESGWYANATYLLMGSIFTDFANTNRVKSYSLLNSKLGYLKTWNRLELDAFVLGNNLTNQINYTFLFLGNNVNDTDPGSTFPAGVATDVNPGPSKANFYGGVSLKYRLK